MISEIEGGAKKEKRPKDKKVTEEQPKVAKGQDEADLASLLKEIKIAKGRMAKEPTVEKKAKHAEVAEEESRAESGRTPEGQNEKATEKEPEASGSAQGKKKDSENDIEEIS